MNKDGYEVRARSGYFAPSAAMSSADAPKRPPAEVPPDIERALGELSLGERPIIRSTIGSAWPEATAG